MGTFPFIDFVMAIRMLLIQVVKCICVLWSIVLEFSHLNYMDRCYHVYPSTYLVFCNRLGKVQIRRNVLL